MVQEKYFREGEILTNLSIQPVNRENFPDFLELVRSLADYEHLVPPDMDAQKRLQDDCLNESPKFLAYIGYYDGKPVSYITLFFTYSTFLARPTLYLEDIFVLEEYRNKGIGTKLIRFCRDLAKEKNCGRMEWMVLTWNTPSIEFYEKCGAKHLDWFVYRLTADEF